jgi:sec-independent protein translocase protein TatC
VSVTDHLDELRWRLIGTIGVLVTAFAAAWWRADDVFTVISRPLDGKYELVTLGVTEPLFSTITVCAVAAGIVTFPIALYQAWKYVKPALAPDQQKAVRPLLAAAPGLMFAGVAFAYFVVLGPAVSFLLGMGADRFSVSVRAQDYYSFVSTTLIGCALAFQLPLVLLGLAATGIVRAKTLRTNRRLAYLIIAVIAALLPTADPVSLVLEMLPLLGLYELSILLVARAERRALKRERVTATAS